MALALSLTGFCCGSSLAAGEAGPFHVQHQLLPETVALSREAYSQSEAGPREGRAGSGTGTRLLYGFESVRDGEGIGAGLQQGLRLTAGSDYGVTQGRQSARLVAFAGQEFAEWSFSKRALQGWGDYTYLAVDVFTHERHPYEIHLELWDGDTRNYFTRCTMGQRIRRGAQTLRWRIDRAARNGREGLQWHELKPADVIDLHNLVTAKLFLSPRKERNAELWIDQVRLEEAYAVYPAFDVGLPHGIRAAADFGPDTPPVQGFERVSRARGVGAPSENGLFTTTPLRARGGGWPDPLAGTHVEASGSGILRYHHALSNGVYDVWLCGGPIIRPDLQHRRFLLKVNQDVLHESLPSRGDLDGLEYLYRFLWTPFSIRPHGLWHDTIDRMYPVHHRRVSITDGRLSVVAKNFFLSALIISDATDSGDMDRMAARLKMARLKAFDARLQWAVPNDQDEAFGSEPTVFVPGPERSQDPMQAPAPRDLARRRLSVNGCRGERVYAQVAIRGGATGKRCRLEVSDLRGRGERGPRIPAGAATISLVNHRYSPGRNLPMVLLPTREAVMEAGLTRTFWIEVHVPDQQTSGLYMGRVTVQPATGDPIVVPLDLTVHDVDLDEAAAGAFGFYYHGRNYPPPHGEEYFEVMRRQFEWMAQRGFTSVTLPGVASVTGVNMARKRVAMSFDDRPMRAAVAAGMGATEANPLLLTQLDIARSVARHMPGIDGAEMDRNPGLELRDARFEALWTDAMRQYAAYLRKQDAQFAFEVIDEPREHPNPWNRNLEDTITYARWMGALGLRRFVTPMGDSDSGKDYTRLVDVTDIMSLHTGKRSRRLREKALSDGKTLWFFNSGMSRLRWGFLPWAYGAQGRFEWHWSWPDTSGEAWGEYPGREWYNPFTRIHGMAPNAPLTLSRAGFLPSPALLRAASGVQDYRYLATLERRLADPLFAGSDSTLPARASATLDSIRAQVRRGEDRCPEWRSLVVELLEALQAEPFPR